MSATKKSPKKTEPEQPVIDPTQPTREQELLETCQRIQAEFENYKKRTTQEQERWHAWTKRDMIGQMLPIIDNLTTALTSHENKEDEFYKGIEMIYAQLRTYLTEQGVEQIEAEGKQFDPNFHEAMLTEEGHNKPNIVIEVLQQGYTIDGHPMRTAKVKVSK